MRIPDYLKNKEFERPLITYSHWQILKGVFLESPISEKPASYYFSTNTIGEMNAKSRKTLFGVYGWLLIISTAIWLLLSFLVTVSNVPELLPSFYDNSFLTDWQSSIGLLEKWQLLLKYTWMGLLLTYIGGLAGGFILIAIPDLDLKYALPYSVAIGLAGGIGFGLGGGMVQNVALGIVFGVLAGLDVYRIDSRDDDLLGGLILFGMLLSGLSLYAFYFIDGLLLGLFLGLPFGISKGIVFGLILGLIMGEKSRGNGKGRSLLVHLIAAFVLSWLYGWQMGVLMFVSHLLIHLLPMFFYVYYSSEAHKTHQINNNPYLKYARIRLPMKTLDKKLLEEAQVNPQKAKEFADFLLKYRPFQDKLANQFYEILQIEKPKKQ